MSKKNAHAPNHEQPVLAEAESPLLGVYQARLEAFGRAQAAFTQQMETMQRELMATWEEQAASTREMTQECIRNPTEAPRVLLEWVSRQTETLLEQNRRFSHHWLNLLQNSARELQYSEEMQHATVQEPTSRSA